MLALSGKAARETPRRRQKKALQLEDDESDADRLDDDAVVAIFPVPLVVALVPDAVAERLRLADPAPPATASSSSSVSSMKISIVPSLWMRIVVGSVKRGPR